MISGSFVRRLGFVKIRAKKCADNLDHCRHAIISDDELQGMLYVHLINIDMGPLER